MNEKMSTFQMVVFGILIVSIIAGVLMFATRQSSVGDELTPVTMWGTLSEQDITLYEDFINDNLTGDEVGVQIVYTQFNEDEFESELIEALASGEGPDTVILDDEMLLRHENKLFTIDYEFFPQLQFQNSFIQAGEVLLRESGIVGLPLSIDPMVMYWNRNMLNNEGISQAPEYWDEFIDIVPKVVKRDNTSAITKAAIGMGGSTNINNAKEILISMTQQGGNKIIIYDQEKDEFKTIFSQRNGRPFSPAESALSYFAQFSNPTRNVYSWNRALPNSQEMFLTDDLAFYFGFASERVSIIERNPNLNFAVSLFPQSRLSEIDATDGKMKFLAILNKSQNITAAFHTISTMTSPKNIEAFANITGLPPVRREVLSEVPSLAYQDVFNRSALIAEPFMDPDPEETDKIFESMIEAVITGRSGSSEAVSRANSELDSLLEE